MSDPFDYDVFISFSSADEEIVKPVWQELCSNGLRVFWSDQTLKREVGNSWFKIIQKSLVRSKHMLLICSENSMNSKWVSAEWEAFYELYISSEKRRLIPVLAPGFEPSTLPPFLKNLQAVKLLDPQFFEQILPPLGGVSIEKLRQENQQLVKQVSFLTKESEEQKLKLGVMESAHTRLLQENKTAQERAGTLSDENALLREQLGDTVKKIEQLVKDQELEKKRAEERTKELDDNRNTIGRLKRDLDAARKKAAEPVKETGDDINTIEQLKRDLDAAMKQVAERTEVIDRERNTIAQLKRDLDAAKKKAAEQSKEIGDQRTTIEGQKRELDPAMRKAARLAKEKEKDRDTIEQLTLDLDTAKKKAARLARENKKLKESLELPSKLADAPKEKKAETTYKTGEGRLLFERPKHARRVVRKPRPLTPAITKNPSSATTTLVVANLAISTTSQTLQSLFSKAGTPVSIQVKAPLLGFKSNALVKMSTREEALKAIEMFNGKRFNGQIISVMFSVRDL